jgi:hypothetical protein
MFAMSIMPSFTLRSELPVTPDAFWRGMSMDAVNAELRPLITVQSRLPLARDEMSARHKT